MKVMIIGQGGREHALAWKAAQSPLVEHVYVVPGNAGTAWEAKVSNIDMAIDDLATLVQFAKQNAIDLTIVGSEAPLALGIVDQFNAVELACLGPTAKAAQLETSKAFSKEFMQTHHIPTPAYAYFTQVEPARAYLSTQKLPVVIKADGLASGKGVVIAKTHKEALAVIDAMLVGQQFGKASSCIVIEEFIDGQELSFMAMCDGEHILPLASSQDHKSRDNGGQGPNTGGMGAYSPAPLATSTLCHAIMEQVMCPAVLAMKNQHTPYVGFLYAGLMIGKNHNLNVLEFNCRLGDPETQSIMMRLKSDLVTICQATLEGKLDQIKLLWDSRYALNVVLCSQGYPHSPITGEKISGLEHIKQSDDSKVFHAATQEQNGHLVTSGGRVLSVCAMGDSLRVAQNQAYQMAKCIHFPGCFYRQDIGSQAVL